MGGRGRAAATDTRAKGPSLLLTTAHIRTHAGALVQARRSLVVAFTGGGGGRAAAAAAPPAARGRSLGEGPQQGVSRSQFAAPTPAPSQPPQSPARRRAPAPPPPAPRPRPAPAPASPAGRRRGRRRSRAAPPAPQRPRGHHPQHAQRGELLPMARVGAAALAAPLLEHNHFSVAHLPRRTDASVYIRRTRRRQHNSGAPAPRRRTRRSRPARRAARPRCGRACPASERGVGPPEGCTGEQRARRSEGEGAASRP